MNPLHKVIFQMQTPNGRWVVIKPDFGELAPLIFDNLEDISPDRQIVYLSEFYGASVRVTVTMTATSEFAEREPLND